jgi:CrcB protein
MDGVRMDKFLLISTGAVLGANARYWIGSWAAQKWGAAFPFGTLIINVSGSLLLGLFMALTAERLSIDPRLRLLIATGFFGAYTTFSTFTYESITLLLKGAVLPGLLNILGSTALGLIAVGLGILIGKSL